MTNKKKNTTYQNIWISSKAVLRRKTFERKNGHRQYLTQIQIESINA